MNNISEERTVEQAYNFISEVNMVAYQDKFLLPNQVLSKNPFSNNFLRRFLNNEEPRQLSAGSVVIKFLFYYLKNLRKFVLYLIEFIVYYLHPLRFRLSRNCDELILLDTFFLFEKIKTSDNYIDSYFTGVKDVLDKKKKLYAYLPIFSGSRKFLNLGMIISILNKHNVPVICEYQLLSLKDLLYLLYFILTYPFHLIRFANGLSRKDYASCLLRSELMLTLDWLIVDTFSRYLQGRRIAGLPYKEIKVLSWYENQVKDKNLYKGLKESNSKVKIYGAQLFLYPKNILNIIPDENEEIFGIIPDKIIVNGPAFIPKKTRLNYHVGPSLRYANIFNYFDKGGKREDVLALLPYFKDDMDNILRILSQVKGYGKPILVKLHPSVSLKDVRDSLPSNTVIVKEDVYRLFETAKIVIGSGTGSLIEAVSLGIPVIVIKSNQKLDYNYLPDYGKEIVWDEARTAEELLQKIAKIVSLTDKNPAEVASIANKYKEMFFCNPTEENIIKAFDL